MNIAIIHATAGAGHMKAAQAIDNGIKAFTTHQSVCIDALDWTNPYFKKVYPATYVWLITKAPWVWGFFFAVLDQPWILPLLKISRRIYNGFNTQPLEQYLIKEKFDVIVCTHFLAVEVVSHLKRHQRIKAKVICVVTDYDVHQIWLGSGVDIYTCATEYTQKKLMALGVHPSKIRVTGIPVNLPFTIEYDKRQVRQALGIAPEGLTVLLTTGSFGIGPIKELIGKLVDVNICVVCGHNQKLYSELKSLDKPQCRIFGLVQNMHELMAASDVMVTKPGGLSVAEALAMKLPMIFFSAIPGQETGNIRVLKYHHAADQEQNVANIVSMIQRINHEPSMLLAWQERLKVLSKPQAVVDIVSLVNTAA